MNARLAELLDRIAAGSAGARQILPSILADPRAYPREAMLLALIAAMAFLLLVTLGIIVWDGATRWVRSGRTGIRVRRRGVAPRVLGAVAAVLLVVLALAVVVPSNAFTSKACGRCHATELATKTWETGDHRTVGCYGCHAGPGVLGALEASVEGVADRLANVPASPSASVDSRSCLRCHEADLQGVVGDRVRMRHAEVVAAGMLCTDCHMTPGHGEDEKPAESTVRRKVMTRCLICHDDVTASAKCSACHPNRPSDLADEPSGRPTPIRIACADECHTESVAKSCIACHGLVLPHPEDFFSQHAARSAADPALCARCHETASPGLACACHVDGSTHGSYSEWFPRHGPAAQATGLNGCRCHSREGYSFCRLCHSTNPL